MLERPWALALPACVDVTELDPAFRAREEVVVVEVFVADVPAHGDRERDRGHACPCAVRPVDGGARDEGRGDRSTQDEHVRTIVDEPFQHGGVGGPSRPGDGPQRNGVHGQGGRRVAVARARLQLGEQAHERPAIAGHRAARGREGGDGGGLGLQRSTRPARGLHGGEARLARASAQRAARGLTWRWMAEAAWTKTSSPASAVSHGASGAP